MNITDKKIRNILKEQYCHSNRKEGPAKAGWDETKGSTCQEKTFYEKEEIPDIISMITINLNINETEKIPPEYINSFIMQYVHFSKKEKKYYFDVMKKNKTNTLTPSNSETIIKNSNQETKSLASLPVNPTQESVKELEKEVSNLSITSSVASTETTVKSSPKTIKKSNENSVPKSNENSVPRSNENSEVDIDVLIRIEREFGKNYNPKEKKRSNMYTYPKSAKINYVKRSGKDHEPYGDQWIHDEQVDDEITLELEKRAVQYDKLRAIKLPKQRTKAWFDMRENKITASDGGCVLGVNHYNPIYEFIYKKTLPTPFQSNKACYHGKKLEQCATMVYEYRMNVTVADFGLMGHPVYDFLGASPDGICNRYKKDGIHKSRYVGRMLEIKCPQTRKIYKTGEIIDHICPIYYWVQVQLQLECCDLEECDFWQCDIAEYLTRNEFIEDTDVHEPFRSKQTGYEKGCLIQLLPKKRINDFMEEKITIEDGEETKKYIKNNDKYDKIVYEDASFIYAPEIEMSPYECDIWVAKTMMDISNNSEYEDRVFDRVIYWKLQNSCCVTINRDRQWFAESLPKLKQVWDYVVFFRNNKDKLDLWDKFIKTQKFDANRYKNDYVNNRVLDVAVKLCNPNMPKYIDFVKNLTNDIENPQPKKKKERNDELSSMMNTCQFSE